MNQPLLEHPDRRAWRGKPIGLGRRGGRTAAAWPVVHLRPGRQARPARGHARCIRFVRPDVAVLFTRAHVKFKEDSEMREIETILIVAEQAKWQIGAFENTKISGLPTAAQAAARLATEYGNLGRISDDP
jgi:hypothetical protein